MKSSELTPSQRARLDQAFALMRQNVEHNLREIVESLCSPRRSERVASRIERILRTTDNDMFGELLITLFEQSDAEIKLWGMMAENLRFLVECNKYRDGADVVVFDIFAPPIDDDDDDDEDC